MNLLKILQIYSIKASITTFKNVSKNKLEKMSCKTTLVLSLWQIVAEPAPDLHSNDKNSHNLKIGKSTRQGAEGSIAV